MAYARRVRSGWGGRRGGFGGNRGGFGGNRGGFGGGRFGGSFGFSLTFWAKWLLIGNTAIFLVMAVGLLPADWAVRHLGFSLATLLTHPWSPITYMFVHGGFWHLFGNMIGLFFFGPPLERAWGSRYFLQFYLVAGLGGALFALPLAPLIGMPYVIGASGAVFGLLLAFALNWPEAPIYIWGILPIKAKWFVGILGAFALLGTVGSGGSSTAHWAHLGGLVTGFLFLRYGDRLQRAGWWKRTRGGLERLVAKDEGEDGGPPTELPVRRARGPTSGRIRPRRGIDGDTLDEVDRILDKIREKGIDSLTEKERAFLDEVSRRYQKTP